MTVREIVFAMLRRWYVLLGVILIAAGLTLLFIRDGGIYTTKTVVSFTLPDKTSFSPSNGIDDASVIAFTAAVAREINGGRSAMSYSTDDAPFYGAGVRQGVLVGLPNAGNQWVSAYLRAEIEIQIVGRTEEWVAATQADLIQRVTRTAEDLQAPVVSANDRITTDVVPLTTQIDYVSPDRLSQIAAAGAMFLAALIVGAASAVLVDTMRSRHHRRQRDAVPLRTSLLWGDARS